MSPWFIGIAVFIAYRLYKSRQAGTATGAAAVSSLANAQRAAVILNAICMIMGIVYLFSFNSTARFLSVASCVCASVLIIYTNYGIPKVSRAAIKQPLQEYFGQCMNGAEFPFLFFSLMFLNDHASKTGGVIPFGIADYLAVLLMVRRTTWFLGTHGAKAWTASPIWTKYGAPIWGLLKAREGRIMELVNLAEVCIGLWLVLLVVTPARQLMTVFVYWTFLRIRYMTPRTKAGHVAAWSKLDNVTSGVRAKFPLLDKPVHFMTKWFNQQP